MQRPIALIAMPGGGKSTIGRHLAKGIGAAFVDSDHLIEQRVGMPVREFFEREGEDAFRDLEEQAIDELTQRPGIVLATGGGAVLREANRRLLRERASVVYLRAAPDELLRRLRHDTQRPLLQVRDPARALRDLFQQREPLYRATAHYVIDTGRPSVATLVNMIVMQLELAGVLDPHRAPRAS